MTTPIVGITPGPWFLNSYREPYAKYKILAVYPEAERKALNDGDKPEPVCVIAADRASGPHDEANGQLIAAAHDMIQALMDIDDWLVQGLLTGDALYVTSAKQTVRTAIDKALS